MLSFNSPILTLKSTHIFWLYEKVNMLVPFEQNNAWNNPSWWTEWATKKETNWDEGSGTCKNVTDLQDMYCPTFLHCYLQQYRHHLRAVLCLETVQNLVGVELLWRWGPNTWMAAQYSELRMLKNEKSFKIQNTHLQNFNLTISELPSFTPVNFSPLPSFRGTTRCICEISTGACLCESSKRFSFSRTHILHHTLTLLPVLVPVYTT
jgi:hypothetical protein